MRVTFVAQKVDLGGGGSNQSLDLLASHLGATGHDVKVVTISPERNSNYAPHHYELVGVPEKGIVSKLGSPLRVRELERAYRAMSKYRDTTDVFHVFHPRLMPVAGLFGRANNTPVVVRLNTYNVFCPNMNRMRGECYKHCTIGCKFVHDNNHIVRKCLKVAFYKAQTSLIPYLARYVERFFALTPAVKRIYSWVGLPADRITVVPNFFDPEFSPDRRGGRSIKQQTTLNALYVGRICELKGVDVFLKALSEVDSVNAVIVGDGESKPELEKMAVDLGISERVVFTGWVKHYDLPEYYRRADVFVHPGRWPEPSGRTILESLQCGVPVIISDIGGPPWVAGKAGESFRAGDYEDLASVLQTLQKHPERLAKMRGNCKDRLANFTPQRVVSDIESEYEALVKNRG